MLKNKSCTKTSAVRGNTYTVLGLQHNCYNTVPVQRVCRWCWALWPALQKTPSQASVPSSERSDRTEDHRLLPQTAALEHKHKMSSQSCTLADLLFFRILQQCVFDENMMYNTYALIYLNSDIVMNTSWPVFSWKPVAGLGLHNATGRGRAVTMGRYCRRSAISLSRP